MCGLAFMLGASILQDRSRSAQGYEVGPKARGQDHLPAPSIAPAKSKATQWSQRRVVFTLRVMAVVGTMQEPGPSTVESSLTRLLLPFFLPYRS